MDRDIYISKQNSKRVIKRPFNSTTSQTFHDLIVYCQSDESITKKLSLFKDQDYFFTLEKFKDDNVEIHNLGASRYKYKHKL